VACPKEWAAVVAAVAAKALAKMVVVKKVVAVADAVVINLILNKIKKPRNICSEAFLLTFILWIVF